MLKIIFTMMLFVSVNAFACWKVEGTYAVDGETWKINQKFDHGKDYALPMGVFQLHMKIEKDQTLSYKVFEKKGITQTLVTNGTEKLAIKKTNDIYAKGEEGQPNSILTLTISPL